MQPPPLNNNNNTGGIHQFPSISGGIRSNSFDDNGPLLLPDGVTLPPTVSPTILVGRLRRAFFELTPAQMREVLVEYDDAVREKGQEIRSHAACEFINLLYMDISPSPILIVCV